MIIRPANNADVDAVAEIWRYGWADGHQGHVPPELVAARTPESFVARAFQRVANTAVAVVGETVAGFVIVIDDEAEQVYVDPDHRGSGVAGALLAEAERLVRRNGYDRAWLAVVAGNERARRFYARQGWADEGLVQYQAATADGGQVAVEVHRYTKLLPG